MFFISFSHLLGHLLNIAGSTWRTCGVTLLLQVWPNTLCILNPHQFSYTPVIEPLFDLMMFLDEVKKKLPGKEGNISDFNTGIRSLLSQPRDGDSGLKFALKTKHLLL